MIVLNNSWLAFVELEMKAAGIVEFGTDLRNPNFAKMAEAASLLGLRAETPELPDLFLQPGQPAVESPRELAT